MGFVPSKHAGEKMQLKLSGINCCLFLIRRALLGCCALFSERQRLAGRAGINLFPSGHEQSHQTQGQVIAATAPVAENLLGKKRNLFMAGSEIEALCLPTATILSSKCA